MTPPMDAVPSGSRARRELAKDEPAETDGGGRGARRRFLLLHDVENKRPPEHLQHQPAEELRTLREVVLNPQLADPDQPILETWLE